jgi:beta-galactosidase
MMKRSLLALLCVFVTVSYSQAQKHSFTVNDTAFILDGKPFQIISGEMHYPRIPKEAWRQRMKMAKAMGINTIGTYAFWNVHEPERGKFDFSGNNDIAEFVKIAKEEGLWVVLRPSPYVCAEWEFGGYPYWLQNIKGLVVRSKEPQYLKEYENYIDRLGKELSPLLVTNGGNILLMQVENEYGAYGTDRDYLEINRKMFVNAGFNCLLNTCDQVKDVEKGILPGLLPAVNGTNSPEKVKSIVNRLNNGKGPYFVSEWYPAWFDWWGEQHHTVPSEKYAQQLDGILGAGISINMYMFHGGTTRGFMNGANCYDTSYYQPQTSSYDYDAPLDEAGNATPKFMVFRKVIARHLPAGQQLPEVPAAKKTIAISSIVFNEQTSLMNLLPKPVLAARPMTFEELHQGYGYVLYRTKLKGGDSGVLRLKELRDYAVVFINGKKIAVLDRMKKQDSLWVAVPKGEATLDILVENLGRINFGPNLLKNNKGITEAVLFNQKEVRGWSMFSLPMAHVDTVKFTTKSGTTVKSVLTESAGMPVLKKATFHLDEVGDTYLDMRAWGKGCVWVNGHHLGRYWEIGPQQTLYLPVEWLKKGNNTIEVLELLKPEQNEIRGLEKPILDQVR